MPRINIRPLLNQDATIEKKTQGTGKYGQASFSSPTAVKCRFEQVNKVIMTDTKEREPIDGIVFVGPSLEVEQGDRVTFRTKTYKVMRSSAVVVGSGEINHYELMVQKFSYN